jgi:hypothetical protein
MRIKERSKWEKSTINKDNIFFSAQQNQLNKIYLKNVSEIQMKKKKKKRNLQR